MRLIFRSRWAALMWAAGICLTAVNFAGSDQATINAANSADTDTAQAAALLAEDD